MAINAEFYRFIRAWTHKAEDIPLTDLGSYFDKFFTLYVVYNRLYAETTFVMARDKVINLGARRSFPDKEAATCYVSQFLGSSAIMQAIEADPLARQALADIITLIDQKRFSIKLHMVTGRRQRFKDLALLRDLRATSQNTKASALLETIYAIRCNMFHGHKGFEEVQIEILSPTIAILTKIVELLREELENH